VQNIQRVIKIHGEPVVVTERRELAPNVAALRLCLNEDANPNGKAGSAASERYQEFMESKPQTALDVILENETKWKGGHSDD
jgi:hypothetical protein